MMLKVGIYLKEELICVLELILLILLTALMASNLFVDLTNVLWKDLNIISKIKIYAQFGVLLIIEVMEIKLVYLN